MSERDRPTGQHLRISDPDRPETLTPDEIGAKPKPQSNSDLDLLPRRFDFFVAEVRDFMSDMQSFVRPRVKRIEDDVRGIREWQSQSLAHLNRRIDDIEGKLRGVDTKLDRILTALEKEKS